MRVVFCGNPSFALPSLEALRSSSHEIAAVITSPDKPRGRGLKTTSLPVKDSALAAKLSVFQPESLKDIALLNHIQSLQPDCLVVVAFRILPRSLFALPKFGSINVHPSLLPKGRGPAPIRWTLIRGESETGVSIIQLSEMIDGGAVLMQEKTLIGPEENFGSLHDRLAFIGARLLVNTLDAIESGRPPRAIDQDESAVTRAPKLVAADFRLDWRLSAPELFNRVRAFAPMPGAVTALSGQPFKVLTARLAESHDYLEPGRILLHDEKMFAGTGAGALQLTVVQPAGKRSMPVADYLRGRPQLPEFFG